MARIRPFASIGSVGIRGLVGWGVRCPVSARRRSGGFGWMVVGRGIEPPNQYTSTGFPEGGTGLRMWVHRPGADRAGPPSIREALGAEMKAEAHSRVPREAV